MNIYRYFLLGFILTFSFTASAAAQTPPLTLQVRVGFDGYYKINQWTPIQVVIENSGPNLLAELRVRDTNPTFGTPSVLYHYPVDLPNQSRKQFTLYLPLRGDMRLEVQLVDSDEQEIMKKGAKMTPLAEDQATLIGVVASDLSLLNSLARSNKETGERVAVAHLDLTDLPTTAQAWQSLDLLVFDDIDTSPLTPAQQAALSYWIYQGGHLISGGGPSAATTLLGLHEVLPFPGLQNVTLSHPLTALQELSPRALADRGPYPVAVPTAFTGEVLLAEQGQPLLIRHTLGQGQADYFTLGLNLAPLDQLLPQIWPDAIGTLRPQAPRLLTRLDPQDILRSLTVLANQGLPNPGLICLYLCLYVLFVGPITYLALRLLKRGELAWLTIPVMVFLCTTVIYLTGFRLRGNEPILTQLNIMTVNRSPLAEMTTFMGVYSPYRAHYALKLANQTALITGLPDSAGVSNELSVTLDGHTQIENLRGDIGGMPAVMAQSQTVAPSFEGKLHYDLAHQKLTGEINNASQTLWHEAALVLVQVEATRDEINDYDNSVVITSHRVDLKDLAAGQRVINETAQTLANQMLDSDTTFYPAAYKSGDPILVSRDLILKGLFQSQTLWTYHPSYQALQNQPEWSAYLVAWAETAPLPVADLTSHAHSELNQTLLILQLPLEVE